MTRKEKLVLGAGSSPARYQPVRTKCANFSCVLLVVFIPLGVHPRIFSPGGYFLVMSYLRVRTIRGRKYLYRQTSVQRDNKVHTISEYLGFVFCAPIIALSDALSDGGNRHASVASSDAQAMRHQEQANRKSLQERNARSARSVRAGGSKSGSGQSRSARACRHGYGAGVQRTDRREERT